MRKTSARVVLNRAALNEVGLQLAAGVGNAMAAVIEQADVPDDPPIGKGLVQTGGWGVWYSGRKVGGNATKPRAAQTGRGIAGFAGWGSPLAHLIEFGTAERVTKAGRSTGRGPAEPFAMPAWIQVRNDLQYLIKSGMGRGFRAF